MSHISFLLERSRVVRISLLGVFLFIPFIADKTSAEDTMRIKSSYGFSETLIRLRSAMETKGMKIFATIDHRAAAHSIGLDMPPATVLVYGNPSVGTPLMIAAPDFAIELPLRVLVREEDQGAVFVILNSSRKLEGKHGLPAGMAQKLSPAEQLIAGAIKESPPPERAL